MFKYIYFSHFVNLTLREIYNFNNFFLKVQNNEQSKLFFFFFCQIYLGHPVEVVCVSKLNIFKFAVKLGLLLFFFIEVL